jgi:outer membrane receptor protein involved in Fe transport
MGQLRFVVFLFALSLYGQDLTGVLSGTIRDASGGVVPNAEIVVLNAATAVVAWRGKTDGAGQYLAPALQGGRYHLTVEARGFKKAEIRDINLQVDQRARVDAVVHPGDVVETVTVSGEILGQLESETSSVGATINTSQVQDLPLPSRNVLNLLTLVGGVSSGGAATGINASQLSINGSRTLNSEFMVDGVSVVSGSTGGVQRLPSTETIREFKVLTSGYSAEYGRTSGGFVNVVVDSGTGQYHGGVYEYFRNEALNANNFFNNLRAVERPRDRYNQFGAKLGGPIRIPKVYNGSEKSFFFVNYEGLRRQQPSTQISTIPNQAFRSGDFSASPVPVHDPLTGLPFPGNRIPRERIDTAAARVMGLLPAPNSPGSADAASNRLINNYVFDESTAPTTNEITTRIDHSLSDWARLFGRLTYFKSDSPRQIIIPGDLDPAVGDSITTGYQTSLGYTHAWTPTLISEASFGFQRQNPKIDPPTLGFDARSTLGIERSVGSATPRFLITGWRDLGSNENTYRRQIDNVFHTAGALTWVRGAHTMKFGFQLRMNQFNVFNPGGNFMGIYNFNGEITSPTRNAGNPVNALADFLLGQIQTAQYSLPQPITGRRNSNFGVFAQDDWKLTPRLTVNLGLRYEYESPMTIANDMYSRVSTATGRLLVATKNASRSLDLEADKSNFAPRVGFAYSLTDRTVIRAAFGMFYSQIFSNLGGIVLYPGFTVTQNFNDLGVGIAQPFALREGHPLTAVQDFNDPFFIERQSSPSSPLAAAAQFGEISPLPYSMQWNLGVQRDLGAGIIADVSYIGSRGVNLPLSLQFNSVPFELGEEVARAGSSLVNQQSRRFPNVNNLGSFVHAGTSSYHSLQLKGVRQFSKQVSFLSTYTWSKSLDDGSGIFSFSQPNGLDTGQFPNNLRYFDRGLSSFDRPHTFALAVQYLTQGHWLWRGIQFNPILIARSGLPDTITQNNLHPSANQQRPSLVGDNAGGYSPARTSEGTGVRSLVSPSDPNFPFVPTGPLFTGTGASRTLVLPVSVGTLGRNTTREPREVNLDLSVARRFTIAERLSLQIRAEAFNVLNHTNFNAPNTSLSVIADSQGRPVFNSPAFGLITAAKSARFMQLVARFEF